MKKRVTAVLLTGLLAVGLSACGQQENPAEEPVPEETAAVQPTETTEPTVPAPELLALELNTTSLQDWQDGQDFAKGSLTLTLLREESAETYRTLGEALEKYRTERQTAFEADFETLSAEAESRFAESPDSFYGPYYCDESLVVTRADTTAVSLLTVGEQYSGGVHGYGYYRAATFDSATGERLKLSDVLTDVDAFQKELLAQVTESHPEVDEAVLEDYVSKGLADSETGLVWTLGQQSLTVYFAAGEVNAYAAGPIQVQFPFKGREPLVAAPYTAVPGQYTVPMTMNHALGVELGGTGAFTELAVFSQVEDYEFITSVIVTLGEERCEQELFAYHLKPTYVHAGEGRDYLYVEAVSEDDYRSLLVFDLSGGEVRYVGTFEGAGLHSEDYGREDALTNPAVFALDSHLGVLGSTIGTRLCHVGEDGMPVPEEAVYTIRGEQTLTVKTPVAADLLDESGAVAEAGVELPKGTKLTYHRSDGSSYMDMTTEDGRECRFTVKMSDWPHTINGEDVETLFDGIVFAG